jgi:hypothetical protein
LKLLITLEVCTEKFKIKKIISCSCQGVQRSTHVGRYTVGFVTC